MPLQLDPADAALFKQVGRQYSEMDRVLTTLRAAELERMALTSPELFLLHKGRVQLLTEIRQLFQAK